jgi:hypothetical protein
MLGPAGAPRYLGLSPRLAADVFRTPDTLGRLPVLLDPRTDTVPIGGLGVVQLNQEDPIRLRQELVPDLVALQQTAAVAGFPFWVKNGLQRVEDRNVAKVLPTAFIAPCAMDVPPPPSPTVTPTSPSSMAEATPGPTPSVVPARIAPQAWLGTVIQISDEPAPQVTPTSTLAADESTTPVATPAPADEADSLTIQWLHSHAWEFGFVPALPESDAAAALGHEPWTLRWVGRAMAAEHQPLVGSQAYGDQATGVLRQAEDDLASEAQAHGDAAVATSLQPESPAY